MTKIIGYPLGLIMWFVYQIVNNYAWSIVFFTLITKIMLFPLSIKQQKSQVMMTAFQPKLEKLKKQYGKNQQKLQEEQMKLYQQEGINPMSSCLPVVIQFPILIGIFDVVYRPITHILRFSADIIERAKEIASALFGAEKAFAQRPEIYILRAVKEQPNLFSEMPDFVDKVSGFNNTLFGFIDLGSTPSISPEVWNKSAIGLVAIAVASGIIQLAMTIYTQRRNKKINPGASGSAGMAGMSVMLYGMPLFSVWIAFSYPAGVGFYWAISALFSFLQSILLYRIYTPEYVQSLLEKDKLKRKAKNNKRPGIMQRYQELIDKQNASTGDVQTNSNEDNSSSIESAGLADEENENEGKEVRLSKSKQKEYERLIIAEARRKQAEKYGEEYTEDE